MHGIAKIGCGLLLAVAVAGCHSTVNTVSVGDSLGTGYSMVQTDYGLSQICKVISARKTRTDTGALKVQVELMNTRNHDERFVYKFLWLDANGMEIPSITNDWQVRVINGKETIMLTGVAADPRVKDCRVKMQESVQ
jgi:uncharacterized protein YcfL